MKDGGAAGAPDGHLAGGNLADELDGSLWLDAGLDDAEARLERVLKQVRAGGAAVSFDADTPAPERDLLGDLAAGSMESVSFGAPGEEAERGGGGKVEQFFDRMLEKIGATARVETRDGGSLVVFTRVDLDGDFTSAIDRDAPVAELDRHRAAMAEALRTRQSSLRIILATVTAAVKIAVAAGTGNPLLALPAAWKFIRSVMAEWELRKQAA